MHRKAWPPLMVALALLGTACASAATTTSSKSATTIAQSTTITQSTTVADTTTTTLAAPTTTTTNAPEEPVAVLGDGILLGFWSEGAWHNDPHYESISAGDEYHVFAIDESSVTAVAGAPQPFCDFVIDDHGFWVELSPNAESSLAISAHQGVSVGLAIPMETEDAHLAVAHTLLAERGVDHPEPSFAQLIRTDLDRDGTTEVLAVLKRGAGSFPSLGDYGIVFMMFDEPGAEPLVIDEHVVTELSDDGDDWFYTATTFRYDAVVDLNGDGVDEVAISSGGWEWWANELLEWHGADEGFIAVLGTGCGV